MDDTVIKLVCPKCATSTTVRTLEQAGTCPHCGQPLAAPADDHAAAPKPDAADGALIADLREALGFNAAALGPDGPGRIDLDAHSSDAFGRALGASTLPAGRRLDDFEILDELGRGGMGVVYRARQISLGREVALKVLPSYARYGRSGVQRFRAEAQAAARLHHTNIVPVYAQGEHDGDYYYAMELIDGIGLDAVIHSRPDMLSSTAVLRAPLRTRPSEQPDRSAPTPATETPASPKPEADAGGALPWTRADYRHISRLMAEVADGLDHAHSQGVIHRDVKPHNLLLGIDRRLHLTDFGLARLTDQPHLTVSGEVMGTPAYLSPEQVRADKAGIDHHTDVYSLGVTLYELITRRKPFDGETREQIITGICTAEPVAPRRLNARIPIDLETICLRAMAKEARRRHPSAGLLAADLRRFADGRPILSRRISRLEKAAKWVRRHKALTAAAVATVAALALVGGLAASISAARQREAEQLLHDAYERLAYIDYHLGNVVAADVERAAELGADQHEVHLTRALGCMGTTDWPGAIQHLEAAVDSDSTDLRAWYLLAWAQRENCEFAAARATFDQAEQRGPPVTADAWFFRGLASHYDEPSTAVESYRQANTQRARAHAFYPQAVLHLARARNQQCYATRSLDAFPDVDTSLRQLIEHQHYGAYPYYLLSIAHRLAAEIYSGSSGTRDDSLVSEHYEQALAWARRGQQVDPANDRPITAEAECLESMGRYAEAVAARSRAIDTATTEYTRCEGHHYRWRLRYWLGDLENALSDVEVHAGCDPDSPFYAHVYPALILAEQGHMDAALDHARAVADEEPNCALSVLWSATCLRLLGQPDEAQALLANRADTVDFTAGVVPPQSEQWLRALYGYCITGGSLDDLEALARRASAPWKLWGEAHFHAAALRLARGERAAALEGFIRAYRSFDGEQRYTYHAKLICRKMLENPAWPPWITVSWNGLPDSGRRALGDQVEPPVELGEGES